MRYLKSIISSKAFKITAIIIASLIILLPIMFFIYVIYDAYQNDADWKPSTHLSTETNIALNCDVFDVSQMLNELEQHIPKYNESKYELYPIIAQYRLSSDKDGTAMYAFKYGDDTGIGCAVEFHIDITEKKIVDVIYMMGYDRAAPDYPSQSFNFQDVNVQNAYYDALNDNTNTEKVNGVLVTLASDKITSRVYYSTSD